MIRGAIFKRAAFGLGSLIYLDKVRLSGIHMDKAQRRIKSAVFKPPLNAEEAAILAKEMEARNSKDFKSLAGSIDNPKALALLVRHSGWRVRKGVAFNSYASEETRELLRCDPEKAVRTGAEMMRNVKPAAAVIEKGDTVRSRYPSLEFEMGMVLERYHPITLREIIVQCDFVAGVTGNEPHEIISGELGLVEGVGGLKKVSKNVIVPMMDILKGTKIVGEALPEEKAKAAGELYRKLSALFEKELSGSPHIRKGIIYPLLTYTVHEWRASDHEFADKVMECLIVGLDSDTRETLRILDDSIKSASSRL